MWGSAINAITIPCARRTYLQIEMVQLIQLWAGAVFLAAGCWFQAGASDHRRSFPCIGQRRCVVPGHPHRMHACVAATDSQSHNLFLKQTHNNHCFLEPPGIPKGPDCSDQHFRIQNPGPNQMDCPRKFKSPRSNEIQVVTNSMTYIQPCTRSCGMHRKTWIFA